MDRRSLLKFLAFTPLFNNVNFRIPKNEDANLEKINNKNAKNEAPTNQEFETIWSDLKAGDQLVIGGVPAAGKTLVALNILNEIGINQQQTCLYFSVEENSQKILHRLMAIRTELPVSAIVEGKLENFQLEKIIEQSKVLSGSNLSIDDSGRLNIEDIISKIRKFKINNTDLKYVFIDYLQLIDSGGEVNSRSEKIKYILSELKRLAISEKLIIISLSQLNKSIGKLGSLPRVENLREIKDFSNIDKIALVHRGDSSQLRLQGPLSKSELIDFINFDKKTGKYEFQLLILDRDTQRIRKLL